MMLRNAVLAFPLRHALEECNASQVNILVIIKTQILILKVVIMLLVIITVIIMIVIII